MSTAVIIDLITVGIILIFSIVGLVQGFAKSFISIFGTLLSFVFSILLCVTVVSFLEERFGVVYNLTNKIKEYISLKISAEILDLPISQVDTEIMKSANVPNYISWIIILLKANSLVPSNVSIASVLCPTISYYVWVAISFVILFVLFKLVFYIIGKIIYMFKKDFKKFNKADRALGVFAGMFRGGAVVCIIIIVLSVLPIAFAQNIYSEIVNAPVTNFVKNINVFDMLLSIVTKPNGAFEFLNVGA